MRSISKGKVTPVARPKIPVRLLPSLENPNLKALNKMDLAHRIREAQAFCIAAFEILDSLENCFENGEN